MDVDPASFSIPFAVGPGVDGPKETMTFCEDSLMQVQQSGCKLAVCHPAVPQKG